MKQYEDQLRTIVANTTSQEKADNPEKATTQEITNSLDLGASGGNSLPLDQSQTNIQQLENENSEYDVEE